MKKDGTRVDAGILFLSLIDRNATPIGGNRQVKLAPLRSQYLHYIRRKSFILFLYHVTDVACGKLIDMRKTNGQQIGIYAICCVMWFD